MKSYVVIGLGRFGSRVAKELCRLGCEVLAMDISAELVSQLSNDVTHAVVGDGQDKEVLRALGVREFDCGIVAIGDSAPKARLFEAGADHYMKDFSEFDCAWLQF